MFTKIPPDICQICNVDVGNSYNKKAKIYIQNIYLLQLIK